MKFKTVFLSMIAVLATGLAACGGGGGGGGGGDSDKYNVPGANKTTISGFNFGGGIGQEWLNNAAERFAKLHAETSYAPGKKGVYIKWDYSFEGKTEQMATDARNFYFDERFSDITDLSQAGLLLNLDEIYYDSSRSGGTLDSKVFSSVKEGLKGADGHYYGLPHYEYYGGLSYNREVFDKNLFYFAFDKNNAREYPTEYGTGYFVTSQTAKKSVGPDGIPDNEDDGFPCTIEEFLIFCQFIKEQGIKPICISGQYDDRYCDYLLVGLWTCLAGAQQMKNYYNCSGDIEVVERDANGNIVYLTNQDGSFKYAVSEKQLIKMPKTKVVTLKNDGSDGYLGNDMAAKYYAVSLYEVLYNNDFFYKQQTEGQYGPQKCLYFNNQGTYPQCAFLAEGSYWYNESREQGCFKDMERLTRRKESDLDLRWAPLPVAINGETYTPKEQTYLDMGHSYGMINGNIKNDNELKTAVIEFMKFLYSEEELIAFSSLTGMPRMINYEMNDSTLSKCSKYYSYLFKMRNKNLDNVVPLSGNTPAFKARKAALKIGMGFSCIRSNPDTKSITMSLKANLSGETIFNGFAIKKADWKYPA